VLRLEDLTRVELADLGREYMLAGQVNDRTGLAAVRLGDHDLDFAKTAIEEWMGASPIYTRRLQRAFGFEGDDVPTVFKGLQLDCGFSHQFMDVRYEVTDADHGRFWLESCGALLDVEPMGEDLVFDMCHTIEDPTFDATAVATNRHSRIRPVHRPPRAAGVDPARAHCEWTIVIDRTNEPIADHPNLARVGASLLAEVELVRPPADPADDGWSLYDGEVLAEPHLEVFSRDALVLLCKEVGVQVHLLVRSVAISVADAAGDDAAVEVLENQFSGSAWLLSERLTRFLGHPVGTGDLEAMEAVVALHPAFQPQEYQPIALERDGDALHLRLLDGPAAHEGDLRSWAALLRSGRTTGLDALVQGVNRQAVVEAAEPVDGQPAWTIRVDPTRDPAVEPGWAALGRLSGTAEIVMEPRLTIRR